MTTNLPAIPIPPTSRPIGLKGSSTMHVLLRAILAIMFSCGCLEAAAACGTAPSLIDTDLSKIPNFFGADDVNHFSSGGQLFFVPDANTPYFWNFGTSSPDLDVCAKVRAVDTSESAYAGIVFWYKDQNHFSVFDMTPDGSLYVDSYNKDHWNTVARLNAPANLQAASDPPIMEVQTQGFRATFLVNNVSVGSIVGDKLASAGRDGGLFSNAGAKRPIYAFSGLSVTPFRPQDQPAITQPSLIIGGTPPNMKPADDAPAVAPAPPGVPAPAPPLTLDEPFLSMYEGLDLKGMGSAVPAGYKVTDVTQSSTPKFGKADMHFQISGNDLTGEITFRFYASKAEADAYYLGTDARPYVDEVREPGAMLSFDTQHVDALDADLPVVSRVLPEQHSEWSRVIGSTDALVVMATVTRTRPEILAGARVDGDLAAIAGDFVSKGLLAAKEAAAAMLQNGIATPDNNEPVVK